MQSTDPKDNQQTGGNKRKGINNNCKGENTKKNNKDKKNQNSDNFGNNVGYRNKEKWKVKFPCNIFMDDHLNHQFPYLEEAQNLLEQ